MKKAFYIIMAVIFFIIPACPWVYTIASGIRFDSACGDYLRLAANANSIDLAERYLSEALEYIEEHDLTHGYTKTITYYPKNDIGIWYDNIKTAHEQLVEMQGKDYTELEQSNMLMKLRESLTDDDSLCCPQGIALGDSFTVIFWLNVLLWLPCFIIAIIFIYLACNEF